MILLDTCTLLWLAADQSRLSEACVQMLRDNKDFLFVSAISAFEISLKQQKGRLTLPLDAESYYLEALATHGATEIPIDGIIAARSAALPPLHADPADRLIVATAQRGALTIVTPDRQIRAYPGTNTAW